MKYLQFQVMISMNTKVFILFIPTMKKKKANQHQLKIKMIKINQRTIKMLHKIMIFNKKILILLKFHLFQEMILINTKVYILYIQMKQILILKKIKNKTKKTKKFRTIITSQMLKILILPLFQVMILMNTRVYISLIQMMKKQILILKKIKNKTKKFRTIIM